MRTKLLSAVFCIVQGSLALITPNGTRCSNLASRIGFNTYHAKHLNSTYHAATTVHVPSGASNISNNIPFCEVYASVNYAKGANLVFALWLPDQSDYEQRFLAVGDGAFGGVIDSTKMMDQLNLGLGFAVAGGDAGHDAFAETNGTTFGYPGLEIPFLRREPTTKALIRNAISILRPSQNPLQPNTMTKSQDTATTMDALLGGLKGSHWHATIPTSSTAFTRVLQAQTMTI